MRNLLCIAAILLGAASWAGAATKTWVAPGDPNNPPESWNDPNNWNPAGVPTIEDDVVLPGGTNLAINFDASSAARTITFQSTGYTLAGTCGACTLMVGQSIVNSLGVSSIGAIALVLDGPLTVDVDDGDGLLLQLAISGSGPLVKTGAGTLTLSGPDTAPNTYSGETQVQGGILELDKQGATAVPAALTIGDPNGPTQVTPDRVQLIRPDQIADTATITIHSTGLLDLNNLNEAIGPLTMNGGQILMHPIGVTPMGTLTLTTDVQATSVGSGNATTATIAGFLALGSASRTFVAADGPQSVDLDIQATLSGSSVGFTKTGTGTMRLSGSGANTYTGATLVHEGILQLGKSGGVAVPGSLTVGDATGGADADVVRLVAGGQIADSAAVSVSSSGLLDLNDFNEGLGALAITGGHVRGGTGELTFGSLTVNNAAAQAVLEGTIVINTTATVSVEDGNQPVDLLLSAAVNGNGGLTKAGAGRLALSGSNAYTGLTTVSAGALRILSLSALGSNTSGVTVTSGAALELEGDLVLGEPLTLSGSGIGGAGALVHISGQSHWNAAVSLLTTSTISVLAGQLELNPGLSGAGGLTKIGQGRLVLRGDNTLEGPITVDEGILAVRSGLGLGSASAGTTVGEDAILELDGSFPVAGESLTLDGADVLPSQPGAATLRNSAGSDSQWTGPIALAGTSVVDVLGSKLTFGGVVAGQGSLVKRGTGVLVLTGVGNSNTYTGTTFVEAGAVELDKRQGAIAIPGDLVIGDGVGGANADVVRYGLQRTEQIADTAVVTLNTAGLFDLTNNSSPLGRETVLCLANKGGTLLDPGNKLVQTGTCPVDPGSVPHASAEALALLALALALLAARALTPRRAARRN